jgi:predicted ATP-dependent endonuclease of OLD family
MKISFVEIQNFRKLKSTRIDFDKQTTIFVGANNSGKTSAMLALRYFFVSPKKLLLRDITIANWTKIDSIGRDWEAGKTTGDLVELLPSLDVWLDASIKEIHHVVHILPTINWSGGLIGVRLQYQPENLDKLRADYLFERNAAKTMISAQEKAGGKMPSRLWPVSLTDFLEKRLSAHLDWNAYSLDTTLLALPKNGVSQPQILSASATPLEKNPFRSLIKIDEIAAQRDFADAGSGGNDDDKTDTGTRRFKRRLSDQLRSYYDRHLDPTKTPSAEDMQALEAIQ